MKKTLLTLVISIMLMTMSVFAHTPGINILTGDEKPLTFNESIVLPSFVENANLVKSRFEGEDGKAIVHYQDSSGEYAAIGF